MEYSIGNTLGSGFISSPAPAPPSPPPGDFAFVDASGAYYADNTGAFYIDAI